MPYCCECGKVVRDADVYCRACGARQTAGPPPSDPAQRVKAAFARASESGQFSTLSPRGASTVCYIPFVGWICAIVVLASERFRANRTVRFHAFQGLYLFVAWLIVRWVIRPIPFLLPGPHIPVDMILQLAIIGVWIYMLVKVSQDQLISLPILGELAEKSASEN